MKSIRTRFAPSPTGFVHLGSLRTALFPYLFAKQKNGKYILRIEDTDQERLVEGAVKNLLEVLRWTGIEPDEGPYLDEKGEIRQRGEYGPYIQSERLDIYKKHAENLRLSGAAYYAFDTEEELESMRARQSVMKLPTRYERLTMRNELTLDKEKVEELLKSDTKKVLRLKIPEGEKVSFSDTVRGEVVVDSSEIDDQVLMKSDGFPTYHLAVVVDDHEMGITDIIRGEDWLPSTPKHILLYRAFGWEIPTYTHLPLIINSEKKKLSKRKDDVSVESYREKGYLPEALINYLALLGWNPGTDQEIFDYQELQGVFSLDKVQKSPAVFDVVKLNWFNKQYLQKIEIDRLIEISERYFVEAGLIPTGISDEDKKNLLKKAVTLGRDRAETLADLPKYAEFLFKENLEYAPELLVWKKSNPDETRETLKKISNFLEGCEDWSLAGLEGELRGFLTRENIAPGNALWPLRVALSGLAQSPGPFEIAHALGKEKTLSRVKNAYSIL